MAGQNVLIAARVSLFSFFLLFLLLLPKHGCPEFAVSSSDHMSVGLGEITPRWEKWAGQRKTG